MAKLKGLGKFDSDAKADMGFAPIPKDKYKFRIDDSTYKENSKKTGMVLGLKMVVQEGDYEGRVLYRNLNMVNDSKQAVDKAQAEWINICRACGFPEGVDDSDELHGIDFFAEVYVKEGKGDNPSSNEISAYESCEGGESPAKKSDSSPSKPAGKKKPIFEDEDEDDEEDDE